MKKTTSKQQLKSRVSAEQQKKIDALNDHAWELRIACGEKALQFAERASKLATKCNYRKGLADSYRTMAFVHAMKGEYSDAMSLSSQAQAVYEDIYDKHGQSVTLDIMGVVQRKLADYSEALKLHEQSLDLSKTTGNRQREAETLDNIGTVYSAHGKFEEALEYYHKALDVANSTGDHICKASVLKNIGTVYKHLGDYRIALDYMQKSHSAYKFVNDALGQAKCLNNIGIIQGRIGLYSEALESYNASLKALQALGDVRGEAMTLGNMGITYGQMGDTSAALECHLKGLDTAIKTGDKFWESRTLNNIAIVFQEMEDYDAAVGNYRKSAAICREIEDERFGAVVLKNMGQVLHKQGNDTEALDCLKKSLPVTINAGNEDCLSRTYCDLAEIYRDTGDLAAALECYNKSLDIAKTNDYALCQSDALMGIGSVYFLQGSSGKALENLGKALSIAEKIGTKDIIYEIHHRLSNVYESIGDFKAALEHSRSFHRVKEEILNEKSEKTRREMMALHEVKTVKREAKLSDLRSIQLAERGNRLAEAVDERDKLLEERKTLMRIAAHNLKSPIHAIETWSMLKDKTTVTNKELTDRLRMVNRIARENLRALQNILSSEAIETGKMRIEPDRVNLARIAREVVDNYRADAQEKSISIHFCHKKNHHYAWVDNSIAIQILDNLMSNALKYTPQGNNIYVTVSNSGEHILLKVKDEGPGIAEKDKNRLFQQFAWLSAKPTGDKRSTGLGLFIVKKLVEKTGGRVWCESEPGKGALFVVEFPQQAHVSEGVPK